MVLRTFEKLTEFIQRFNNDSYKPFRKLNYTIVVFFIYKQFMKCIKCKFYIFNKDKILVTV